MEIYINLIPITTGGGLQNAASFIKSFNSVEKNTKNYIFIVKTGTILENLCKSYSLQYHSINNQFLSRLIYECTFYSNKKNSVIFTLFGPRPMLTFGCTNIVGCAYSNLFYPEIHFWAYLPLYKRLQKNIIDRYRFYFTRIADVVIFETEHLKNKSLSAPNFNPSEVYTVPMAVSRLVHNTLVRSIADVAPSPFKILYLGASHPNKRQHLLIDIISALIKHGVEDFQFITTMGKNSYSDNILKQIENKGFTKYFINIGVVPVNQVPKIIESCHAMMNIALLESFSNNFVEAWSTKRPLIVTDSEWAKSAVGLGGLYINPLDDNDYIDKIQRLISDKNYREDLVAFGTEQLNRYPNSDKKISMFLKIIKKYA